MSDAAWMNAAEDTSVGSATIEADDELFTIVGHGLTVGERVVVSNLSGGAVGVLGDGGVYWVTSVPDVDTFSISLTKEGISIAFSADGGADVDLYQPTYAAAELRRLDAALMFNGTADEFGARQGVRPGHAAVTLAGTTWTVEDLTGFVYPGQSSTDGPYRVAHLEESGSLDPADGTNDRIDALDLQIQDHDIDASGFRRARVVYQVGSPGADPDPPTVTTNALRLATILVSSGGDPSPSIDTLAHWTVASGGTLPVLDASQLPSSGLYDGMMAYDQTAEAMLVREGGAWPTMASPNSPELLTPLTGSGNFVKADYPWGRKLWVRAVGGGAAGGGAPATGAGEGSAGSGGGAGAYAESLIDFADLAASESYSVGSGGSGTTGTGGNGTSSNLGPHVIAAGGTGGTATGPGSGFGATQGGIGGSNASSTGQVVADGAHGGLAQRSVGAGAGAFAGAGGESALGGRGGRAPSGSAGGSDGGVFGGGGSGALNIGSAGSKSGGDGGNGTIILMVI